MAGDLRAVAGLRRRLPGRARGSGRAARERALEGDGPGAVHAHRALRGHRRQAPRVPLRALDPGEVGGHAPDVPARDRAARRARADGARVGAAPNATHWTMEQEYLYTLLVHQLNTGNMAPGRDRLGLLAAARLEPAARSSTRCRARPRASSSTSPAAPACSGGPAPIPGRCCATSTPRRSPTSSTARWRRCGTRRRPTRGRRARSTRRASSILEKVRPAVAPSLQSDLRRDPRISCKVAARVRIGLARICRELAEKDAPDAAADSGGAEQIEVYAVADTPARRAARRRRTSTIRSSRASRRSPTRCGR